MTALEDVLRRCLARQVTGGPAPSAPDALADQVIRRARRLRRRQRLSGVTLTAVFALLAGVGVAYLPDRPDHRYADPAVVPSRPAPLTPAAEVPATVTGDVPGRLHGKERAMPRLPVDVVADDQIVTMDGSAVDISFAGEVSQAYRVAEGWLVVGVPKAAARASVWLVTAAGHRQPLLSGVAGVAVDTVHRKVAWRAGSQVFLASLSGDGLGGRPRSVTVTEAEVPVGFAAGAVVLARGKLGGYDLWWPDRGVYQPDWAQSAVAVYGGLADGRTAVGQVVVDAAAVAGGAAVGERRCLALFHVTTAGTSRGQAAPDAVDTRCGLGLGARSPGWVSPDGRWLVTGAGGRTVLVDLTAPAAAKPRVLSAGPPLVGGVAWLDSDTVVLATRSGKAVMRLKLDEQRGRQAGGAHQWSIPVVAKEAVLVVPRLAV